MTFRNFAAATCLIASTATASFAASVDFNFSFTDGTNILTGLIEGLDSDGAGQAASSITVYSQYATFVYSSLNFDVNSFDVVGSVINASTSSATSFSALFQPGSVALQFELGPDGGSFWHEQPQVVGTNAIRISAIGNPTYTAVSTVPLPAGGLLLLSGLIAAVSFNRRKKRTA